MMPKDEFDNLKSKELYEMYSKTMKTLEEFENRITRLEAYVDNADDVENGVFG